MSNWHCHHLDLAAAKDHLWVFSPTTVGLISPGLGCNQGPCWCLGAILPKKKILICVISASTWSQDVIQPQLLARAMSRSVV